MISLINYEAGRCYKPVNMYYTSVNSQRRLQKELMSLMKEPPPGVTVDGDQASQNLTLWVGFITLHRKLNLKFLPKIKLGYLLVKL